MELFLKKGDTYTSITLSELDLHDNSILVIQPNVKDYFLDENTLFEIKSYFLNNREVIVIPEHIKISSLEFNPELNYLLIVHTFQSSEKLKEQIETEFLEVLQNYTNVKLQIVNEDIKVQKKDTSHELPPLTQQLVYFIDGTPNEDYPLRILKVYRENCNCKWEGNGDNNPLFEAMNNHQDQRAVILDKAIEQLEKELK